MADRRGYKGGARQTTLSGDINDAVGTITGADLSTWAGATTTGPGTATINITKADEETITFTGISGNDLTGVTRGAGGTTAQDHTSGATLDITSSRDDFDEANKHVSNAGLYHPAKCVVVRVSSTVVTLADATVSVLNFDTEALDTDAFHSTSVNTSRLTVPTGLDGKYRVWGKAEFGASATGHRAMDVRVNGATVHALAVAAAGLSADGVPTLMGAMVLALAAGDYVELRLFQNSGGALTFNANGATRFGMEFLGT